MSSRARKAFSTFLVCVASLASLLVASPAQAARQCIPEEDYVHGLTLEICTDDYFGGLLVSVYLSDDAATYAYAQFDYRTLETVGVYTDLNGIVTADVSRAENWETGEDTLWICVSIDLGSITGPIEACRSRRLPG